MPAKRQKTSSNPSYLEGLQRRFPWLQQVLQNDPSLTSLKTDRDVPDEVITTLAQGLEKNTNLTVLDIFSDSLSDTTGLALAEGLRINKSLEKLSLDASGMTNKTGIAVAEAVQENKTLRDLTMISRHPEAFFFGSQHKRGMADFMHAMSPSDDEGECGDDLHARKRKAASPGIQWMTDKTVQAFVKTLTVNRILHRLELGVSSLAKATVGALSRSLAGNTTLQHLFVNGREIGSSGEVRRPRINVGLLQRALSKKIAGEPLTAAQAAVLNAQRLGA